MFETKRPYELYRQYITEWGFIWSFFSSQNTWDQEPKFKTVEQDGQLMFVKTKDTAKAFHVSVAIYCQKHPEM